MITVSVVHLNTKVCFGRRQSRTMFLSKPLHYLRRGLAAVPSSPLYQGPTFEERRIHLDIKGGEQPLPKQNSISLKVSLSPMGFFQNANLKSLGQLLRGKRASPLMMPQSSLFSAITSAFDRYLMVSLYSLTQDIFPQ